MAHLYIYIYIYVCGISSLRVNGPSEPGRLRDVCVCQWVKAYRIGHRPVGTSDLCVKKIWNIHILGSHRVNNRWNRGNFYVVIMQSTNVLFPSCIVQNIKLLYTKVNDGRYKSTHTKCE